MKFFIPWNPDAPVSPLSAFWLGHEEVGGVYGDLASGLPPGGRGEGFFSHLFDALCFNNREFTRPGQKELRGLFDGLAKKGIGSVIVAHPYLALWLRRNYPSMRLTVSSAAGVDSAFRARWWEDAGVDAITLPDILANRDPDFIRSIRRSVRCRLRLLANSGCRSGCPWRFYRCWGSAGECRYGDSRDPLSCLIRPEETGAYEALGIDGFQIGDDRRTPDSVARMLEAYVARSWTGDPAELMFRPAAR